VLFVGCKKQAQETIKEQPASNSFTSPSAGSRHPHNLATIARGRAHEAIDASKAAARSTDAQAEVSVMRREREAPPNLDGIKDMDKYPPHRHRRRPRESIAVAEARRLNIPSSPSRHERESRPRRYPSPATTTPSARSASSSKP